MLSAPRLALALLAVSLLGGCTSTEYRPEWSAPHYPPYRGEVKLLEAFPPTGTFQRLGVVTVEAHGIEYADTLTKTIKKQAAARGANAVVLQGKARPHRDSEGNYTDVLAGWAIRVTQ